MAIEKLARRGVRILPAMIGTGRPPLKEAPPFGRRLREARLAKGWTQAELAAHLDISFKMMDYYERRATNPSIEFVRRAADALDVSIEQIVGADARRAARARPGPTPRLMERFERIQRLPRGKQEFILKFLDTVLDGAEKTVD